LDELPRERQNSAGFTQNSRKPEQGIWNGLTGNMNPPNREFKSDNREHKIRRSAPSGAERTIPGSKTRFAIRNVHAPTTLAIHLATFDPKPGASALESAQI
jgi:hypothetical protein